MTLSFPFLQEGVTYQAQILQDGINANHDAEDYSISTTDIHKGSSLRLTLAEGGGFVIKLTR